MPSALAHGRPSGGGAASPVQPCATALFVVGPTTVGVPVKRGVARPRARRPPTEQQNPAPPFLPPPRVLAHRSGFPPGPSRLAIVMPAGSESPRVTPPARLLVVLVTLIVNVIGWLTTAGPPVIWVTCRGPGVVTLSANAGTAARLADPRIASTTTRRPARLRSVREPRGEIMIW